MATTTNLNTLTINYLTQAQFDAAVSAGTINANQLYLTPDASITGVNAGTGLTGGGTSGSITLNHSNSVTAKSTVALYPISFDAQGHITESNTAITALKNPNKLTLKLFNETLERAQANQNNATDEVEYDGSTANQIFEAAGRNAITSISASSKEGDTDVTVFTLITADGRKTSFEVEIVATESTTAESAAALSSYGGSANTPIYIPSTTDASAGTTKGKPKAVTSIAYSLLPTGTTASTVAIGNHSHGNLTTDGKITTAADIASGDKLVIIDSDSTADNKITGSSITFGTSETTFLTNKGTWKAPTGTTYTFDGTYDASTNKAATVSTVTNAINALDGGTIGTPGIGKTVTAISQTNGNISVTFGNISITKSQISDFPSELTPAAHTHGNINNDGTITSTVVSADSNDALLFADYSNNGKIERLAVFDGITTTQALSKKGTWETFSKFSGSYNDLSDKPTIPTLPANIVNTITTTAGAHTTITSQKGNVSFNIPTNTSHLTNDSGFATSESLVGDYVTIRTEQTITALQKTFNGAIHWGTLSKYGAIHYDSTLDALVFSFG